MNTAPRLAPLILAVMGTIAALGGLLLLPEASVAGGFSGQFGYGEDAPTGEEPADDEPAQVLRNVKPGEITTSDPGGTGTTFTDPVHVEVTTAAEGLVVITRELQTPRVLASGLVTLGYRIELSVPTAPAGTFNTYGFTLYRSLHTGTRDDLFITRNDETVSSCVLPAALGPDPCVGSRTGEGLEDFNYQVLATRGSVWTFAAAQAATPTPTPQPTATPMPTPTSTEPPTPTPTVAAQPTATPTPTVAAQPTATPTPLPPGVTATATPVPEPTATPTATPVVVPTATPAPPAEPPGGGPLIFIIIGAVVLIGGGAAAFFVLRGRGS
ncbi:MAG: hypothetical protein IIC94_07890 [Chloroflexi bacterium]|nr:hypothetical protein [Chloroflexota bacterium]